MFIIGRKKFDRQFNEYADAFFSSFEKNKPILIDAFVKYYGEEYRDKITSKINNCFVNLFVSDYMLQNSKVFLDNISDKDLHDFIKNYKNHSNFVKIVGDIEKESKEYKKNKERYILLNPSTTGFEHPYINQNKETNGKVFISLTSYLNSDVALIHELSHSIRNEVLAISDDYDVSRNGIETPSDTGIHLEEAINQMCSLEVEEIFHNLGGQISPKSMPNFNNSYEQYFPYVRYFYEKYKPLLKKAVITDNLNIFYQRIDKEKFEQFKALIKEQFDKGSVSNDWENIAEQCLKLVDEMAIPIHNEDMKEYIAELQKQGKIKKILNFDENSYDAKTIEDNVPLEAQRDYKSESKDNDIEYQVLEKKSYEASMNYLEKAKINNLINLGIAVAMIPVSTITGLMTDNELLKYFMMFSTTYNITNSAIAFKTLLKTLAKKTIYEREINAIEDKIYNLFAQSTNENGGKIK